MAIKIKQRNENWRIKLNEEWEFENKKDMDACLKELLSFKAKFGRPKNKEVVREKEYFR